MEILYVSTLCSKKVVDDLYRKTNSNPGFAAQKFNRLVAEGFVKNGQSVTTLSAVPALKGFTDNFFLLFPKERCGDVTYRYLPYCSNSIIRRLLTFGCSFWQTIRWGLRCRSNKVIIYDVLHISVCVGSLLASKILGIKSCGIVTDMPGLMVSQRKKDSAKKEIVSNFNRWYLPFFNFYVFLTKAMNSVINRNNRPYIVMEGVVDIEQGLKAYASPVSRGKSVVYAGGLYEEYGVKSMAEAFLRIKDKSVYLDLFGSGPLTDWLRMLSKSHPQIRYHGVVANDVIVEFEQKALLLINPRPTTEEFTRYSFPSKNMEYMLSGTAMLTTDLPGMPEEYHPYVLKIEDETPDGYVKALNESLELGESQLCSIGEKARNWIVTNKNNVIQTNRIIKMLFNK